MSDENIKTPEVSDEQKLQPKRNKLVEKLKSRMPGQTCRLPSLGKFYDDTVLDEEVQNAEVTVFPMTTMDELYLRSTEMLGQGTAIRTVFKRCIPQILDPDKLVTNDVEYLLTFLRKVSYGPMLPLTLRCPHCQAELDKKPAEYDEDGNLKVKRAPANTYDVPIDYFLQKTKPLTEQNLKEYTVTVEDFLVKFKPTVFSEILKIQQDRLQFEYTMQLERDRLSGLPQNQVDHLEAVINEKEITNISEMIINGLSCVIESVDGIKDKEDIREWLNGLPVEAKEELAEHNKELSNWGPEFTFDVSCQDCSKTIQGATTLNPVSFFTLPSSRETKEK